MKLALFKGLRLRVALVILFVSAIPLGIMGLFAVRTADRVIAGIVTSQLENVAADKQELLQRWMAERLADVGVIAGASIVRRMEAREIAPYLELVKEQYRAYNRFVIVGGDARVVCDTGGPPGGSYALDPCYREAKSQGTHISAVRWDPASREAVFSISEVVRAEHGEPTGVVCATVNTQAILAQVLNVSLGETGECYLVDDSGLFLAHKQPQRVLKENIAQSESFANLFGDEVTGPIYTDYRGIAVLGASRRVAGTPWYVVVEQDRDEAFAGSYRMLRQVAIAMVLTVLVRDRALVGAGVVRDVTDPSP